MYLKSLELSGFKSFAKKSTLEFSVPITSIVGPNGSGKSNIAEAFRFVLGEQSMKSMRGKRGEDLIFSGTQGAARSNRASVKLVFDNQNRLLDIDFDEVSIERVVHRDGVNEYRVNGSQVRLKDVLELLTGANIGASGHHIISQGEADRILSANPKERREMIEDALGLKIYQYKRQESERKLLKTEENINQVSALRKEIAPHLKFLSRQVEKIEKAKNIRDDLLSRYKEYLKREHIYITYQKEFLLREKEGPEKELSGLEKKLKDARNALEDSAGKDEKSDEILNLQQELSKVREEKEELTRSLGRLEGQIAFQEKAVEREKSGERGKWNAVSLKDIEDVVNEVEVGVKEALSSEDIPLLQKALRSVQEILRGFLESREGKGDDTVEKEKKELERLLAEQKRFEEDLKKVQARESELEKTYKGLNKEIEGVKDKSRALERDVFAMMTKINELKSLISSFAYREDRLSQDEEEFKRELAEAGALMGRGVLEYENYKILNKEGNEMFVENIVEEDRNAQKERRREVEKMKIRLEELGGGSVDEIMKEYKEVSERDAFLEREIADLEKSAESLKNLIEELKEKLDTKFKEGIEKINGQFSTFFELMFGGGNASLKVVKEKKQRRAPYILDTDGDGADAMDDDEAESEEEGIDIEVSLPRKRIKGLVMLSGGERALTSIALIFAMSQVNPPPFLILDETDAALDEANSKRYGDMIENLSKKSQLVLITHNRETMSRAGILYGITMGGDGVSKILSIKFDEAVTVAK